MIARARSHSTRSAVESPGTQARYCSWAESPYASHQARWNDQRANGVALGVTDSRRSQHERGISANSTGRATSAIGAREERALWSSGVVATVDVCRSVSQQPNVEKVTTTDSSTGYALDTFR